MGGAGAATGPVIWGMVEKARKGDNIVRQEEEKQKTPHPRSHKDYNGVCIGAKSAGVDQEYCGWEKKYKTLSTSGMAVWGKNRSRKSKSPGVWVIKEHKRLDNFRGDQTWCAKREITTQKKNTKEGRRKKEHVKNSPEKVKTENRKGGGRKQTKRWGGNLRSEYRHDVGKEMKSLHQVANKKKT